MSKRPLKSTEAALADVQVEIVPIESPPATETPATAPQMVQAPVPQAAVIPEYDLNRLNAYSSLSQKIRYLDSQGCTRGQIVRILKYNAKGNPLIYQHVNNVLRTTVKKPL